MRAWKFQLRVNSVVLDSFTGTCPECHRRGDALATRLGDIACYAFNEPLDQWQKMGTYRGLHVFTDSFGDDRRIKDDYSGMTAMPGKEGAV